MTSIDVLKHEAKDSSTTIIPKECAAQNVLLRFQKGICNQDWEKDQGQTLCWEEPVLVQTIINNESSIWLCLLEVIY